MEKKVLLGMSGGVDSSVSAILLKELGYEVIGCTMKFFQDNKQDKSIEDAKKVCDKLGINHIVIDCTEEFKCKVINNFISQYLDAKTPNPCVECNKYLKFGVFLEKAKDLGCNYISTGHYAKLEFSDKYNQYVLKKSNNIDKDQSYFLYAIPKEILANIILPLENIENKNDVRDIAKKYNLEVYEKKDSQEICFIEDNDYGRFLEENLNTLEPKGNIVLEDGQVLGKHRGLIYYTIGQRKGLGISYKESLYVTRLDKEKNEVVVGVESDLYESEVLANDINILVDINEDKPIEVFAKIRYRAKEEKGVLYLNKDKTARVIFKNPQRAVTPGQSIVFYDKEGIVIGGGKIINR